MKKNLFCMWLLLLTTLFSLNTQAQMTIGGKKEPEAFSVLELLNKGGLRLPQMTTTERNAFAVKNNDKGDGLTIYNKTTNCVEYWNKTRWVSLCEGTSQTTISPQPCVNVAPDGTGCNQTFNVTDPDCPNGPFTIAVVAGGDYAVLSDVDNTNGTFKINFNLNETVNVHTVLVRVTSTCTSLYKEFLFSQNGVDCSSMPYSTPTIAASASVLCTGGAVYLSVPANTANLDKLIWTRNGIEVARGVSYFVATQKGKYNISMGAVGCNTNAANERNITESGSTPAVNISILATNNGVLCGTNAVTLSVMGSTGTIAWFHNGVEISTGPTIRLLGDSNLGEWFAAVKDGSCYSKPSASIQVTKSQAAGQVPLIAANVLVNGVPLNTFTTFCAGGSLDLSVTNKDNGVSYIWYNGADVITVNPFIVPTSQSTISLRLIATDNSGALCPNEASVLEKSITSGSTPAQPNITGNTTLCDGTTDLTIVPAVAGAYTYTWYKDNVKMPDTTPTITVASPGSVYNAAVTNATGCTSSMASKTISLNVSSFPVLSWITQPASASYGAKLTLQTGIQFGPANTYTWTADKGAVITGSGASVTVQFPATGPNSNTITITVVAENNCGKSVVLPLAILMEDICPQPALTAQSALSQTVTKGAAVQEAVSVTNGVSPTYQWYSNTTASTTGGTPITNGTASSVSYTPSVVGTSYVYCIVTNSCTGNLKATSSIFEVITEISPKDLPTGAGSLSGKSCFDIAESNFNTTCGTQNTRQLVKSDFNLPSANTQTYTFTPSGSVSKVRFAYIETPSGVIIKSITNNGNPDGLNISGAVTATVVYKSTLSSGSAGQGVAYGKTADNALSVDLYVIYNNKPDGTGTDVTVKLTAKIKDCACCGAMVSATQWKGFMCHNLGVNQSLDPFTPAPGLIGSYYVWGKSSPEPTETVASTDVTAWYRSNAKTSSDPCPDGYRVPTRAEWQGLVNNNVKTLVGVTGLGNGGIKFGESLMLPHTYFKSNTGVLQTSNPLVYWGSDVVVGSDMYTSSFSTSILFYFATPGIRMNIRCMEN